MEWYISNPDWWGDVSGALLPHLRMLMMPGGIERLIDEAERSDSGKSEFTGKSNQTQMLVPASKNSTFQKPPFKFLIFGRTGWIGGLLGGSRYFSIFAWIFKCSMNTKLRKMSCMDDVYNELIGSHFIRTKSYTERQIMSPVRFW
ncbi:Trifunctional UDP-glucose 4 [Abeliophyllum distichum]|uniref:Trifunctional UDP-glucose 4 n=1 Tax=Abeliophyllum distichum TaxID=126358 RepID=A0ABD1P8K9_9LAMI